VKPIVIGTEAFDSLAWLIGAAICRGATGGYTMGVSMAIGIGGADRTRVVNSQERQHILQRRIRSKKMSTVAPIMAEGKVKAKCGSGVFIMYNLSSRTVALNSPHCFSRRP